MKVLFDTCTLVHLFKADSDLHPCAERVFEACQQNNFRVYLSTLTVAEYCVKGNPEPLLNKFFFKIIPYDERAALTAAEYSKITLADAALRTSENGRNVIKVDTQILAHAAASEMDYVVTADANTFAKTAERIACTCGYEPEVVMLDESALVKLSLASPVVQDMPPIEQSLPTEEPVQYDNGSAEQVEAPQQLSFDLIMEQAQGPSESLGEDSEQSTRSANE